MATRKRRKKPQAPDKYTLYEQSVQSPDVQVDWFQSIYKDLRKKAAHSLREDFCGTFAISADWVRRDKKNSAQALDLDPEPLTYGLQAHGASLSADQVRRLNVLKQNVISVTPRRADVIAACNFSFCIFQQRSVLLDYFRACLASIKRDGVLILELAGGPGMIETTRETRKIRQKGYKYTYVWHQKSFDPVSRRGHYAIHFESKDWKLKDAFTYDWRMWTIPEIRDALRDAGFKKTYVYWETEHRGRASGEYVRSETGDNAYSWVAYIVGAKS
ncbi:MAG: hypothetical protein A2X94_14945 [Bdellovibrionales bacterium GWB1_55_8]|nr:MAG: hypothetical protein A2X94_14945 [Bdellovibrionales bacterium GWB1_55_8]